MNENAFDKSSFLTKFEYVLAVEAYKFTSLPSSFLALPSLSIVVSAWNSLFNSTICVCISSRRFVIMVSLEFLSVEVYLFIVYLLCGIAIGMFFDIFRVLRRSFKTPDLVTYIEDVIFGVLTGVFLIIMLFVLNNGELRFYIFIAITLGLAIYFLTISKFFIKINVKILTTIKKSILKILSIIFYPINMLLNFLKKHVLQVVLKPFRILTINVKGFCIKNLKKAKNSKKIQKNKKDFRK